jgi:hypothetical protein
MITVSGSNSGFSVGFPSASRSVSSGYHSARRQRNKSKNG